MKNKIIIILFIVLIFPFSSLKAEDFDTISRENLSSKEETKYSKSSNTLNIQTELIRTLIKKYNLEGSYKIKNNWALGGGLLIYGMKNYEGYKVEGYETKLLTQYFFNRQAFTQGAFLTLAAGYVDFTLTDKNRQFKDLSCSATATGPFTEALISYMWAWDHFNITLGGGARYYAMDINVKLKEKDDPNEFAGASKDYEGIHVAFGLNFGYAF